MKIIITLAGNSKRFLDKNYSAAKFTLPVAGKSMLEQILGMFDSKDRFLLVTTHKIFHHNNYIIIIIYTMRHVLLLHCYYSFRHDFFIFDLYHY